MMGEQNKKAEATKTRLTRNRNGGVHYRGCPYAGKTSVPWVWAEGRDDSEWLGLTWLHRCSYCFGAIERVKAALDSGDTNSSAPAPDSRSTPTPTKERE